MTIVDAGPLVSLVVKNDEDHQLCVAALHTTSTPRITTHPVLTEAMHFAGHRIGWRAQAEIWELVLSGGLVVVSLTDEHHVRMKSLMEKYHDVPMDFADASLVAVAESLKTERIFTLDSDFLVYRFNGTKPFDVVPK